MNLFNKHEAIETIIMDNKMALLYFGNDTCGVCKVMKPKLENLLLDYPNIKSAHIEVDKSLDISASYSIFTLPAILVFIEGKEIIRGVRHISLIELESKNNRYYGMLFG